MEFHGNTTNYPNIKVVMIEGGEDVTFKVSDEGGGMPHNKISNLWSYIKPNNSSHMMLEGCDSTILDVKDVPLYGYGCGLPSARLVARYFGGDLSAVSMEGYGSDFYLHLLKAGNVQECTPDLHTIKMISSSSSSSVYELMDSIYHGSS
ncbi:[Pyruvate dehydrogenase (acetyl-transferring)] kinase, mitochondrial [Zancudomyces culisetae]|uniref:Protein-serine/threonine kinase n=1 Tax=Zancudomyces culisetae TaxID=1213189 RepID=A0A1R1PRQ2_ZANCU|nr:[Pyruvate dehydrogenase (acetyl-transferring)] kinase, mitochondrial [Zancudomyces culisetae]|eukprot:OMH83666.1 [Pyruvate dehydrogenase (acetyl-transferring)] kinase, mitochondrial [Zancudomyces culisetae]